MGNRIVGTVISTDGTPSTSRMFFVVNKDANIRKGQYVQVSVRIHTIFGYISEIIRSNRYFERADAVSDYEETSGMSSHFPIDTWETTIAEVNLVGAVSDGKVERIVSPPFPGLKVEVAGEKLIKHVLGFYDNGLLLGKLAFHDIEARLNVDRLLQKHLAILAMSGAGKSHLASVIIEELLDRNPEDGRIAVVIVDVHGEYYGFVEDDIYGNKTEYVNGNDVKFRISDAPLHYLRTICPGISSTAEGEIRKLLKDVNSKGNILELEEMIEKVKASNINSKTKDAIIRVLSTVESIGLFGKKEYPDINKIIKPGKLVVFDLSGVINNKKKKAIVALLAEILFNLRMHGKVPPFLFIVEEAHNFAKEKESKETAISKGIIEKIAREGRKFGASLCLISQRPANLSTTALSQCNTHIIMRVTNPNDLKYIESGSEGIDSRTLKVITSLQPGEMIVVGQAVNFPCFVNVRMRKSKKVEKGRPLSEQAKEWEKGAEERDADIEAYV